MSSEEGLVQCPHCPRKFTKRGLGKHKKACKGTRDDVEQEERFLAEMQAEPEPGTSLVENLSIDVIGIHLDPLPAPRFVAPWEIGTRAGQSQVDGTLEYSC